MKKIILMIAVLLAAPVFYYQGLWRRARQRVGYKDG